jgi:hypothetical protein
MIRGSYIFPEEFNENYFIPKILFQKKWNVDNPKIRVKKRCRKKKFFKKNF